MRSFGASSETLCVAFTNPAEGYEQYWAFKGGCNLEDNFKLFELFHEKLSAIAKASKRVAYFDGNHLVYSPFDFGMAVNNKLFLLLL